MIPGRVAAALDSLRPEAEAALALFIRYDSVSSDPSRRQRVRECARWLASLMRRLGLNGVELIETRGAPIVFADHRVDRSLPTVLVYGHYDVQPASPEGWRSPPFEPEIRNGRMFGRGASDDKGQVLAHVFAAAACVRATGSLPVNLKFAIEGEEEVGSRSFDRALPSLAKRLSCDAIVVSDTTMPSPRRPTIVYGLRGHIAIRVTAVGPARDLHSGHFGGAAPNPILGLADFLSRLHDEEGRIAVPGFYDDVRVLSPARRSALRRSAASDDEILRRSGARMLTGERGYSASERTTIRPALSVHGIAGGHSGPGNKSIVPATATALIGIRLVPDQDPSRVDRLFRAHLSTCTDPAFRWKVETLAAAPAVSFDRSHAAIRSAARALRFAFGAAPSIVRTGGSIPILERLHRVLRAPVAVMGFGLPSDSIHSVNESFSLEQFARGRGAVAAFLFEFARRRARRTSFNPAREAARGSQRS